MRRETLWRKETIGGKIQQQRDWRISITFLLKAYVHLNFRRIRYSFFFEFEFGTSNIIINKDVYHSTISNSLKEDGHNAIITMKNIIKGRV